MDVNEQLARLEKEPLENQVAFLKAHIAIELTFLQIALTKKRSGDREGREATKEKAERTLDLVWRLMRLIEDCMDTADREWIQTGLAEVESALATL